MSALPLPINPELFQQAPVRLSPVNGDNMEPTLRGGWDYVVCAPIDTYAGEGLYLLDGGSFGFPQVFRCEANVSRTSGWDVRLISDNQRYPEQYVTRDQFAGMVLAKVVADLKVRDEPRLRDIARRS